MNARDISFDTETECSCGRSPTGLCVGWHSLDNDRYKAELKKWVSIHFINEDLIKTVKEDSVDTA